MISFATGLKDFCKSENTQVRRGQVKQRRSKIDIYIFFRAENLEDYRIVFFYADTLKYWSRFSFTKSRYEQAIQEGLIELGKSDDKELLYLPESFREKKLINFPINLYIDWLKEKKTISELKKVNQRSRILIFYITKISLTMIIFGKFNIVILH